MVTSRAVTALPALLDWSLRHCGPTGSVVAIKGGRASQDCPRPVRVFEPSAETDESSLLVVTIDVEGVREPQVPTGPLATVVLARYG